MNPSPVLAGTFTDALTKGKDIGQCGPKFNNTGCLAVGIGSTVDALSAIKKAVFDDARCTMAELLEALRDDFEGHDELRLWLSHRVPRWGNADPTADGIARRIVDSYGDHVNVLPNNRGGRMVASMFSLVECYTFGQTTSTLPDGRKAGEPLTQNNSANKGKDKEGVTALLQSMTNIDYSKLPNGSVTDVYLHPSAVRGDDGLNAMISLIKTYFSRGGFGIQFNIFDTETLVDAMAHPENYQTLQIRVCGWNVYFVTLSPFEQEQYIKANVHAL
jgi:formate C-acetyltransferase